MGFDRDRIGLVRECRWFNREDIEFWTNLLDMTPEQQDAAQIEYGYNNHKLKCQIQYIEQNDTLLVHLNRIAPDKSGKKGVVTIAHLYTLDDLFTARKDGARLANDLYENLDLQRVDFYASVFGMEPLPAENPIVTPFVQEYAQLERSVL